MFKTFDADRPIIETKYHWPDQPFNAYKRMAYHGYDYDETTGKTDEEIKAMLLALDEEIKALSHPVAKARAVRLVLENTRIDVSEHDYFVGLYSWNRLADCVTLTKWKNEVFSQKLPHIDGLMKDMNASGAVAIWPDFDHVVPDWASLLSLGFPGIRQRARDYRAIHEAKGITQAQLAEAVGTTQGQIARWETGARNPKVPALAKLAQALGVTIEQLI